MVNDSELRSCQFDYENASDDEQQILQPCSVKIRCYVKIFNNDSHSSLGEERGFVRLAVVKKPSIMFK